MGRRMGAEAKVTRGGGESDQERSTGREV